MNRVALTPALANHRGMVKDGRNGHAPAFGDTLAAFGRAGDRSGPPPSPMAAGYLPNWRGEAPGETRGQDTGCADPSNAGPRDGKSTRSDADGTKAVPWPEDLPQPTPPRDDATMESSVPLKHSVAEAQAQAAAPVLEAPFDLVHTSSITPPTTTGGDIVGAGLGPSAALASPGTPTAQLAPPAPTAKGAGRLDAKDRILTGDPGNADPSANPGGPTQAASASGSAPPHASGFLATLPETPIRPPAAQPSPGTVLAAGPAARTVPRFAALMGAALPSGRDLAAITPEVTATGRTAAQDAGIVTRRPGTEAPSALAPWLVAGGPGQAGIAFRVAPNGPLTGKVGMAKAQADAAFDPDGPISLLVRRGATPLVAGMVALITAPSELATGVLVMPPPALSHPSVGSARAMASEGVEPASVASSQAGSDPNAFLQTDAAAGVPGITNVAAPAPTHPAPPMPSASVADQVAPVMLSAARNGEAGQRVSVSLNPGELGQVNITVERSGNGTMHIQVSAEHLATLELLRRGQDDLAQVLNQAIDGRSGHSLSFSLDRGMDGGGPGSGMGNWFTQSGQQNARASMPQTVYADNIAATPASPAAAGRGGIDVTA